MINTIIFSGPCRFHANPRRKALLFGFLLFFAAAGCFASGAVCLVTTVSGEIEGDAAKEEAGFLCSRIEDGVMDLFYESGFIIFNAGFSESSSFSGEAEASALKLAREGGAEILVLVAVETRRVDDRLYIAGAAFSGLDVSTGKPFLSGSCLAENIPAPADDPEFCRLLGSEIAQKVLKGMGAS